MAGSSAVIIEVTFTDTETGDVIAQPQFYRSAGALSGGRSIGVSDNRMLEEIVDDIVSYAKLNM